MSTENSTKRCQKCDATKEACSFGSDRSRADGLACWCKDCLNANARKWHSANREKAVERIRAWHRINRPDDAARAAAVERTRQWCEQNPDQVKANRKTHKYRRRARERGGMTAAELRQWETSQRRVCHWCAAKCDTYEIDHRIPLSKGGKHERQNLVISCRPCNRRKGARDPVEFAQSMGKLI